MVSGLLVGWALPASAAVCSSSGPAGGAYTVDLCIDTPAPDAVLTGNATVTASATVTGANPGIQRYVFYLAGEYLLTEFGAPVDFEIPTPKFVDGTYALEVEALMRDGFVTGRTAMNVTLSNGVTSPPVNTNTFTPSTGRPAGPGEPFVMSFTGDGGDGEADSAAVANLLASRNPNLFAFVGDLYQKGSVAEFHNHYDGRGGNLFGALRGITNPVIGNHEYENGQAFGYFDYWDNVPDYYSYDANGWHFIALNSTSEFGQTAPGTAQYDWLVSDLAANTAACTVAYFHHPVVSVGPQGGNARLHDMWRLMADNGVDVVVTGHDHSYQRWTPLNRDLLADPAGMTHFVAGGGGHGIQSFARTDPRLAAGLDTIPSAFGALELELNADGGRFEYRSITDQALDSGTVQCSGTPADTIAPAAPTSLTATSVTGTSVGLTWEAASDNVGVDSYTVKRNGVPVGTVGGAQLAYTDTTVSPDTAYTYRVEAVDAAGNRSAASDPVQVTTDPPPTLFTLNPVADSYVDASKPTSNFGTNSQLRTDTSPHLRSYLRFDVANLTGPVTSATLRIAADSNLNAGYDLHQVNDSGWFEGVINYENAPAVDALIGTSGPAVVSLYNEFDVTGYVNGEGSFSFALMPLSSTNLKLSSREGSAPPELIITADTSGNNAPVADDVAGTTDEDTTLTWTPDVSDPDPDPLTCSITNQPSNGTATVASDCSTGSYTPNADFHGPDPFTYRVDDGLLTDDGSVSVSVTSVNDTPTADDQSVTTDRDVPVTITLTGSDPDGDCLDFAVASAPANGSLGPIDVPVCSAGVSTADVEYTPAAGYKGADAFTFTTTDPAGGESAAATVDVTVLRLQTSFTLNPEADSYVHANNATSNYGSSSVLRTDASPDIRSYLRFDVTGLTGPVTSATLRIAGDSSLTAGYDLHQVDDNTWDESTVNYVNAPTVGGFIGTSGPVTAGSYHEFDVSSYISGDGSYSFGLMPLSNTNLKLGSREGSSPPELVLTTDTSGNNPPAAGDLTGVTDEDTALPWTPDVSDPDSDPLTCSVTSQPSNGTATVASDCSAGSYTPSADYAGPDAFTYRVDDGSLTDEGTVSVTVSPVNDTPVAEAQPVTTAANVPVTITLAGSDADGDCPLSFAVASGPGNGSLGAIGTPTCSAGAATATVRYTPGPGYDGPDSFTFTAEDPGGATSTPATVDITVETAPSSVTFNPVADSYVDASKPNNNYGGSTQLRTDSSPQIRSFLRFNVTGLSGPVTSATLRIHARSSLTAGYDVSRVANNTWGEDTINDTNAPNVGDLLNTSGAVSSGSYTDIDVTGYVINNGSYSFALTPLSSTNLRLGSREFDSPPELVLTTDASGNKRPVAKNLTGTTDEDTALTWTPDVSDPDGDPLTCSITSQPSNGTATVASDCSGGSYTPDADFHGPDTFTYQADDGSLTDEGTVSVTVDPVNDTPAAGGGSATTTTDAPVTITLTGTDADGDCPLTFAIAAAPSNGGLGPIGAPTCSGGTASADVTYTPGAGYDGPDSFTFTVADSGAAESSPATVDLTVDPTPTSFTFNPVADSYVHAGNATRNYGTNSQLRADSTPDIRSYLRFDVTGLTGTVTSATLRVAAESNLSAGYDVHAVGDNGWGEDTITYTNAPSYGAFLNPSGAATSGSYNEVDVTAYIVTDGSYSFALVPVSSTNLRLGSRESTTPPELVIETSTGP